MQSAGDRGRAGIWPDPADLARDGSRRGYVADLRPNARSRVRCHVVHYLSVPLKRAIGQGGYVLQGIRELFRYGFKPITLRVDDEMMTTASAIISKGRLYGGRYRLTTEGRSAEPGFSVVTFHKSDPWAALMYGSALQLNLLPRAPGVRVRYASQVQVLSQVPVQLDGDPAGYAPLSITDADVPIEIITG